MHIQDAETRARYRLEDLWSGKDPIWNVNTENEEEVDAEEIADVVSKWTGIPVNKMLEGEKAKLLRLEQICFMKRFKT